MQKKTLHFTKMHGIGNDYVYVDGTRKELAHLLAHPEELAVRISDRHFGVGSDGLVVLLPSTVADIRMRMFNADGSEAEMCGNASRCVAKLAYDTGLVTKDTIRLETKAGIKEITLQKEGERVVGATVDMGRPVLEPADIPVDPAWAKNTPCCNVPLEVAGGTYAVTCVSMGNPHAVLFLPDEAALASLDIAKLGPLFECHPVFPRHINTEFVVVLSEHRVAMRVWERGSGETLACGTGACAVGVACVLTKKTAREVTVVLKGGELAIVWDEIRGTVRMTGPAVTVFEGDYIL